MSYYSGPEALAANPPESWRVVKVTSGAGYVRWQLFIDGGHSPYSQYKTRREALAERDDPNSYLRRAVEQERLWFAGKTPSGWKTYAECLAERERVAAYQAKRREEMATAWQAAVAGRQAVLQRHHNRRGGARRDSRRCSAGQGSLQLQRQAHPPITGNGVARAQARSRQQ